MRRYVKHIAFAVIAFLLLLNLAVWSVLEVPFVQNRLTGYAGDYLTELTGSEISVGSLHLDIFDGLFATDVLVKDPQCDTFVYVGKLNVDYSLKGLYRGKRFWVDRVVLSDFLVRIYAETDSSDFNFQPIINAFSSEGEEEDTTQSSSPFRLTVKNILLENGAFQYDIRSEAQTPQVFNASHIAVADINFESSLDLNLPSEIAASIGHFSFSEQSGLALTDLQTDITFALDSLVLAAPSIQLSTQNSTIKTGEVCYNLTTNTFSADLEQVVLLAPDFQCFADILGKIHNKMTLSAQVEGTLPSLSIQNLKFQYPGAAIATRRAFISDYSQWANCPLGIESLTVSVDTNIAPLLRDLAAVQLPQIAAQISPITLQADVRGSLPQLAEQLTLNTKVGQVSTQGTLSYLHDVGRLAAETDINLSADSLQPIVGVDLDSIRLALNTSLVWNLEQQPNVRLDGALQQAIAMGHHYSDIRLNGAYLHGDSVLFHIDSPDEDANLALSLQSSSFLTDSMWVAIETDIRNLAPRRLHLADGMPDRIAGKMQVEGIGMDYNRWNGALSMQNLRLTKGDTLLAVPTATITQKASGADKTVNIDLPFLTGNIYGEFNYEEIYGHVTHLVGQYLPSIFPDETDGKTPCNLHFALAAHNTDSLLRFFGISLEMNDQLTVNGSLDNSEGRLTLDVKSPQMVYGEVAVEPSQVSLRTEGDALLGDITTTVKPDKASDFTTTCATRLAARNDSIFNRSTVGTSPDTLFLKGDFGSCISFAYQKDGALRVRADFQKSSVFLNNQEIVNNAASVDILPGNITIRNFGISTPTQPLMTVDGTLSASLSDTLSIGFDNLSLSTILSLLYINDVDADCHINGTVKSCATLDDKFRFFTRDFRVDSLTYNGNNFGDITANAIWDNTKKGILAKVALIKDERKLLELKGVVSPIKQLVHARATLDSLPLAMAMPVASQYVSQLGGCLGANISVEGNLTEPDIKGYVHFKDATAKVNYTGVAYTISDSIKLDGKHFYAKQLKVKDNFGNILYFNGDIKHDHFQKFNYEMTINMRNFALLNNPKDRQKTVYGKFFANARGIHLKGDEKEAEITGEFSNGENTSVYVNLPDFVTEANTYDNIVYVKAQADTTARDTLPPAESPFDIYANLTLGLTDKASFFVSIADGAMIRGNGNLKIIYEDKTVSIYNRFTVNDGYMKLKLSGLPSKKFSLQEGSYVEFAGDPMKLRFNATALYGLTADLSTLGSNFKTVTSTRVPVNCQLKASGDLTDMDLSYDIVLPKADEDLKQSVASIINTDNIKVMEFAYLIGLGTFNDPSGQVQNDAAMSFASSSLSSTLNNALSGVLGDKVTIGTDFSSSQEDLSDMEVGVSVSTKLAHDKLLLSTNLGVQKQAETGNESSFLGDFDAEYLLGRTGMFRIKAYNHTNNDVYRTSNNTQGVGFSFVRESKRLKNLFKIRNEFRKKSAAPTDTLAPAADPAIRRDEKENETTKSK